MCIEVPLYQGCKSTSSPLDILTNGSCRIFKVSFVCDAL